MNSSIARHRGQIVADFLARSWREIPPPLDIPTDELELITALLFDSGGAGLAWWRIRESDLKITSHGTLLHQGYRLQALRSAIQEERTENAFRFLRNAGIEPLLIKGWSVARLYPHPTLRAYGDIDLLVRPEQFTAASEMLRRAEANTWWIDLHKGLSELEDRSTEELFERSRTVDLKETSVRVLCPEDNLALLAIHLFKHGAWRPSWLCDIAVIVESLQPDFDWGLCFGSNEQRAGWIASAIVLAHQLLKADIDKVPLQMRIKHVPEWLIDAVFRQWGNLLELQHLPVQPRRLLAHSLGSPRRLLREIFARWPDPIVATFNLRGRVNNFPRLPYQLSAFALQAGRYLVTSAEGGGKPPFLT